VPEVEAAPEITHSLTLPLMSKSLRLGVVEITDVQAGEILVSTVTSPAWAPIFPKIRAAVTDIGGIMSHAAIVCREYGLPAVTGTAFGTKTIKTGQRLRVDGNTGTVTIID